MSPRAVPPAPALLNRICKNMIHENSLGRAAAGGGPRLHPEGACLASRPGIDEGLAPWNGPSAAALPQSCRTQGALCPPRCRQVSILKRLHLPNAPRSLNVAGALMAARRHAQHMKVDVVNSHNKRLGWKAHLANIRPRPAATLPCFRIISSANHTTMLTPLLTLPPLPCGHCAPLRPPLLAWPRPAGCPAAPPQGAPAPAPPPRQCAPSPGPASSRPRCWRRCARLGGQRTREAIRNKGIGLRWHNSMRELGAAQTGT
jgi:hypothetical protein